MDLRADGNYAGNTSMELAMPQRASRQYTPTEPWGVTQFFGMEAESSVVVYNGTNSTSANELDLVTVTIAGVLLSLIIIITIAANAVILIAFCTHEKLRRRPTNHFYANLAVTDLLAGIFVLPLAAYDSLLGMEDWTFGKVCCITWISIDYFVYNASVYMMCAICLDRYLCIVHAVYYRNKRSLRLVRSMNLVAWFLGFVTSVPGMVLWEVIAGKSIINYNEECFEEWMDNMPYVIASMIVTTFIPLFMITFLYIRIYIAARYSSVNTSQEGGKGQYQLRDLDRGNQTSIIERKSKSLRTNTKSRETVNCISTPLKIDANSLPETQFETTNIDAPGKSVLSNDPTKNKRGKNNRAPEMRRCASLPPQKTPLKEVRHGRGDKPMLNRCSDKCIDRNECKKHNAVHDPNGSCARGEKSDNSQVLDNLPESVSTGSLKRQTSNQDRSEQHSRSSEDVHSDFEAPQPEQPGSNCNVLHRDSTLRERRKRNATKGKRDRRAAKVLGTLVGMFLLSYTPWAVAMIFDSFCSSVCLSPTLYSIAVWLQYSNSIVNPFLYVYNDREFRVAVFNVLQIGFCCCRF